VFYTLKKIIKEDIAAGNRSFMGGVFADYYGDQHYLYYCFRPYRTYFTYSDSENKTIQKPLLPTKQKLAINPASTIKLDDHTILATATYKFKSRKYKLLLIKIDPNNPPVMEETASKP
jgi:hypothetical protein